MGSTDLTHFLLPTSRLPKDVTFIVGEYPVSAHKAILAAAHPFFDKMFFGTSRVKVNVDVKVQVKVEGEVHVNTFLQFLRHLYGHPIEVANIKELSVLVQLYSICCQFKQVELGKEVVDTLEKIDTGAAILPTAATFYGSHVEGETIPGIQDIGLQAGNGIGSGSSGNTGNGNETSAGRGSIRGRRDRADEWVRRTKPDEVESKKGNKMEMELLLQRMKTELMVEVKAEVMELKSAVNAEMMVLKAEVAKSRLTLTLPECLICLQDMTPPTRIIQCQMGHKLCEPCYDAMMRSRRSTCPGHCGTGFIGRDLGMEAFLRQLTGKH